MARLLALGVVSTIALGCAGTTPVALNPTPIIIYVTPSPVGSAQPTGSAPGTPIIATPSPTHTVITPTPGTARTPAPTPAPTPVPTFNPDDYPGLTARQWSQLVKSPDDHAFETYRIWGCITQFDASTGPDAFRAQASYRNEAYWFSDGENSWFEAHSFLPAGTLDDFVSDDVFLAYVVVLFAYTYDTTLGGQITVPAFSVIGIEHKGTCG